MSEEKKKKDNSLLERVAIGGITTGLKVGSKVTKVVGKTAAKATVKTGKFAANVTKGVTQNLVDDATKEIREDLKVKTDKFKEDLGVVKDKAVIAGEEVINKTKEGFQDLGNKIKDLADKKKNMEQ